MKYKIGDVVRVKSLDWYNENKDSNGCIDFYFPDISVSLNSKMASFFGKKVTIEKINGNSYSINEDGHRFAWTDGMFEEPDRQLVISDEKAKQIYKTSSVEFKSVLEDTFGKDFFVKDIREKVKNIGDARELFYEKHGRKNADMLNLPDSICTRVAAYACTLTIADALNEGWEPNWQDPSEDKFVVYNNMGEYGVTSLNSSRYLDICFKSKELAEYFIKQFPNICKIIYQ